MSDKKYILFAGGCYYPRGVEDFRAVGSIEELKKLYADNNRQWGEEVSCPDDTWGQIAEHETMKIVLEWNYKRGWGPYVPY